MYRTVNSIFLLTLISTFFGCNDDKFNTLHPKEGGIALTVDWSKASSNTPSTYQALVVYPSGESKVFDNLSGTTNNLNVEPGEATIYVYNRAEHISVSGSNVSVNTVDGGIAPNPGLFFSHSGKVFTERDKDIAHNAVMNRQTGELKFSLAIKPASMIDKVKAIHAVLEGVASAFDMQTGNISAASVLKTTLSKSSYYATGTVRLLGFDRSAKQNLQLEIELENGNKASVTTELTSLITEFNNSKNTLFFLNADMYISDGLTPTITVEKWEHHAENRYLSVSPSTIELNSSVSSESAIITTDQPLWVYSIIQSGNWLTATKLDDRIHLSATANTDETERQATVNISAGGLTESVIIIQQPYVPEPEPEPEPVSTSYADKEVVKLQSATVGNGINIVLMGDGYTISHMDKGTGKYEQDMRATTEHIFSVYPFTRYRDYFNVYMIAAISNQEGISVETPYYHVDNKFETVWDGGNSTRIMCSLNAVIEYVNAIPELAALPEWDGISVIMPVNAPLYAGTCRMFLDDETDFANGFSISMCTFGTDYRETLVHEFNGHGFAKLDDEYIYFPKDEIPDEDRDDIIDRKQFGWYENVDFSDDILQTSWKGFANNPKYYMVGAFEGASYYGKGIWRPEFNSCMNDNTPYFNAPSRWAQVRRIMHLAGIDYTFSRFLQDDIVPVYPAATRSTGKKAFVPLARPVVEDAGKLKRK